MNLIHDSSQILHKMALKIKLQTASIEWTNKKTWEVHTFVGSHINLNF